MANLKHTDAFERLKELSRLKLSKRGASKILRDEGYFKTVESARKFIRHHTGADGRGGKVNIQWLTDVPTPVESEFGVIDIPKETDGIGLLCDIHIP